MSNSSSISEREPAYLNVREFAALLRLSPTAIYNLVARREIPFVRLAQGLRFEKRDVQAFLQSRTVEPIGADHV
jgi:excisionase family DNA binding protein